MKKILLITIGFILIMGCGGENKDKNKYKVPELIKDYCGNVQANSWWKYENQYGEIDSCWVEVAERYPDIVSDYSIVYYIKSDLDANQYIQVIVSYINQIGYSFGYWYGNEDFSTPYETEFIEGSFDRYYEFVDTVVLRDGNEYYDVLKIYQQTPDYHYILMAKNIGIIAKYKMDSYSEWEIIEYGNIP